MQTIIDPFSLSTRIQQFYGSVPLAPVDRFPVDILTHIFTILQEVDSFEPEEDRWDLFPLMRSMGSGRPRICALHWMLVSQVCRRWRDVALSCSILWCTPVLHLGPEWFLRMLERARSAPLHLTLALNFNAIHKAGATPIPLSMFDELSGRVGQFRSLKLTCPRSSPNVFPPLTWTEPATMLHSLEIHNTDAETSIIPSPFFLGGHFPRLRRLVLCGVSRTWTNLSLEELTHFDVSYCDRLDSYEQLFNALGSVSRLQFLKLGPSVLPGRDVTFHPIPRIELPCLQSLELHGRAVVCANVLRSLELSDTVNMTFPDLYGKDGFDSFFSELRCHYDRGTYPTLRHLRLISSRKFGLKASDQQLCVDEDSSESGPTSTSDLTDKLSFTVNIAEDVVPAIRSAFSYLPLANVASLIICGPPTPELWEHGLVHLPHVRSLVLDDSRPHSGASHLVVMDTTETGLIYHFPELETLEFDSVDLCRRCLPPNRDEERGRSGQALFLSALTRRAESTRLPKNVRFIGCVISKDHLWKFEMLGLKVTERNLTTGQYFDETKEEEIKATRV